MCIRDRRFAAAPAIGDRPGLRPGAFRSDHQRACAGEARDRAAAGTNRHQVDHGETDRPAADAAIGGEPGLAPVDQGNVGRGAADIDADEVEMAGAGTDVGRADGASRGAGERGLHGRAAHGARAGDAAARFHEQERRGDTLIADAPIELGHIGRDHGHDGGVENGGHAALVFPEYGQHLARQRDQGLGHFVVQDFADAALMTAIGVTVQQHHGDGVDALGFERARSRNHGGLVERGELGAVGPEPPADLEDQFRRHGTLWFDPSEQAGAARHLLASDLQHVLEAGTRDERGPGAFALEDQVGCHRRAMQHAADIGGGEV
jgi:hypothetical protein